MRKGTQRPLKTPGTNRKVWISGALNFKTGCFHWVTGERKNDELFIKLLDRLRRTYRCHKELHLYGHRQRREPHLQAGRALPGGFGRQKIRLHPLPSCSPQSNPVDLVWWSVHEAVSRATTSARRLRNWRSWPKVTSRSESPSGPNSGRSKSSWKGQRHEIGECLFILWTYLVE
jgi:transposase